ncbi:MAG: 1-acyl-sn-glycerol-3-phosphate acyltransferase [Gammaproteobacteria bacterium]|nr:1-acyl-sn-glycerol-3-phosphate acyltransferase [Gammaproteobacteria bacterium]
MQVIRYPLAILGFILLGINTLLITVILTPVAYIKKFSSNLKVRTVCLKLLHFFGTVWIYINYGIIKLVNNIKWEIDGLEALKSLPKDKWYLLIANHQSWNDIFVLQFVFKKIMPFQKYFVKEELRKFPIMGLMWEGVDCPFLKRLDKQKLIQNPELASFDITEIREKSKQFKLLPATIVNFVEGSRFNKKKQIEQNSPYKYLLKPKAAGIACILQELNQEIKGIIDVSIYYQCPNARFWDLFSGGLKSISVKIQYISIPEWLKAKHRADINYSDYKKEFQRWLNNLWLEKDQFLASKNSDK